MNKNLLFRLVLYFNIFFFSLLDLKMNMSRLRNSKTTCHKASIFIVRFQFFRNERMEIALLKFADCNMLKFRHNAFKWTPKISLFHISKN